MKNLFINTIVELKNSAICKKSKIGRIRELLPEIELAQQAGVRLADIADALNQAGFEEMNHKCLQNLLYQARKKSQPKIGVPATTPSPMVEHQKNIAVADTINPDAILQEARQSMRAQPVASSITLSLLRSNEGK